MSNMSRIINKYIDLILIIDIKTIDYSCFDVDGFNIKLSQHLR